MKRPTTLADVHRAVETLREELGELGGELLHRSDADRRCLNIIAKKVAHLHDEMAKRKVGDTARTRR